VTDDELREFVRAELRHAMPPRSTGILAGDGDPTGVVDAAIGTIYRRRDGGAGTSLYVKEGATSADWAAK
jgi:hypothetical protein